MLRTGCELNDETFEEWVLGFDRIAAPGLCAEYISHNGLEDVQPIHTVFEIVTPTVDVMCALT